jgi:heterodisulfide reductase subunit A-like polyferredoxin
MRGKDKYTCNLMVEAYANTARPLPLESTQLLNMAYVEHAASVIVVGAGPGGLFAALRFIELGLSPL